MADRIFRVARRTGGMVDVQNHGFCNEKISSQFPLSHSREFRLVELIVGCGLEMLVF